VQLHQARLEIVNLRNRLGEQLKTVAALQAENFALQGKLIEHDNAQLRSQFGLETGRTIHRDDDTGEIWWDQA
jgi:hypothetical protein